MFHFYTKRNCQIMNNSEMVSEESHLKLILVLIEVVFSSQLPELQVLREKITPLQTAVHHWFLYVETMGAKGVQRTLNLVAASYHLSGFPCAGPFPKCSHELRLGHRNLGSPTQPAGTQLFKASLLLPECSKQEAGLRSRAGTQTQAY